MFVSCFLEVQTCLMLLTRAEAVRHGYGLRGNTLSAEDLSTVLRVSETRIPLDWSIADINAGFLGHSNPV